MPREPVLLSVSCVAQVVAGLVQLLYSVNVILVIDQLLSMEDRYVRVSGFLVTRHKASVQVSILCTFSL